MPFRSIVFDSLKNGAPAEQRDEPEFFPDLNLDQVLDSMVLGREKYDLKPLFYTPLHEVDAVTYRYDILRDLEKDAVSAAVKEFARGMDAMRGQLEQAVKLRETYQKERWFLDAIEYYCGAVQALASELAVLDVQSRGLQAFRGYLTEYAGSTGFKALAAEAQSAKAGLDGVEYCTHIKGNRVTVSLCEGEPDYSAEIEAIFARFKQGAVKDYRAKFPSSPEADHVEAQVLERVARLFPNEFQALDAFAARHRDYLDGVIGAFDREVQFYLAYLEYAQRFKSAGLPFCYPAVSTDSKEIHAADAYDLALATKLVSDNAEVVTNELHLTGTERIFVITGPNQGGKTTFARMVGQLHYLASLGLPVPARDAALFLPDRIFTHFEKEEDLQTLRGKLEDELVRIHNILQLATGDSLLIMNESFASTTLHDALLLGTAVMKQLIALGLLGVYVTFIDELASLGPATVSLMSTVVPEDPATRTFRVIRTPANGLAYAAAIAEKYGLSYESLRRRIAR